jgi:hypothetical protein
MDWNIFIDNKINFLHYLFKKGNEKINIENIKSTFFCFENQVE